MRIRLLVLTALLALGAAACDQNADNEPEAAEDVSAEEFAITGMVLEASEGAQPEGGIPGVDVDADVDAEATDGGADVDAEVTATDDADEEDAEHGGFAIEPDDDEAVTNLDDCEATRGAYLVYYTEDTEFEPASLEDDQNFPDNLEDMHVTVTGRNEADDGDDCLLVIESVEEGEEMDMDMSTDDATTGGTGDDDTADGDADPSPSGSPTADEDGETFFPTVDDTDPVFEGTASPDPCEGQDACRETDSP